MKSFLLELGLKQVWQKPPKHLTDYHASINLFQPARDQGITAAELSEKILNRAHAHMPQHIEHANFGGGYVNIKFAKQFFAHELFTLREEGFTVANTFSGVTLFEYTDPNPFKVFHIGHLMSNTVGESLSRIAEAMGHSVKRCSYQGDVGMHVACAVWGLMQLQPATLTPQVLGEAYVLGAKAKENEASKLEITEINKKIYARNNDHINELYDAGRTVSLDAFEKIYTTLGTHFDAYFFESVMAPIGMAIVKAHPEVFEESDGAVVFKGEKFGLHTRVLLNKEGLPTYEAKELGLAKEKMRAFANIHHSYTITANEQSEYMKVMHCAMKQVSELIPYAEKFTHLSHGVMKLPTGKMSSRTGDVISFDELLANVAETVQAKAQENERTLAPEVAEAIALAALKFTILKQAIGKDVVFDVNKDVDFEGDTGPYLLYALVRAKKLLRDGGVVAEQAHIHSEQEVDLAHAILTLPTIVHTAFVEQQSAHPIAQHALAIAHAFSTWYASEQILNQPNTGEKLALVQSCATALEKCILLLGMKPVDTM